MIQNKKKTFTPKERIERNEDLCFVSIENIFFLLYGQIAR